jgi:hypothetical protein
MRKATSASVIAPQKYANFLVSVLNENDSEKLEESLRQICTSDVKFNIQVYNIKDFQKGSLQPTNVFGNFQSASLDLKQFLFMQSLFNEVMPDAFTELLSSRNCMEADTPVYISCFRMKGTIITENPTIGSGDASGNLVDLFYPNQKTVMESIAKKYSKEVTTEGSLVMCRNKDGKITEIDFYYEFLENDN